MLYQLYKLYYFFEEMNNMLRILSTKKWTGRSLCQPPTPETALTLRILVSLLGFWASKVKFVDKFKLMEDPFFLLQSGNIKSIPYHFVRGWIYYLADTCGIAVMHNSISCLYLDVLFFCLPGVRPDKICQAKQRKLSQTTA